MQGRRGFIVGIRKGLDILPGTCLLSIWLNPTNILKLAAVTDVYDNHCSALVFFTMLEAAWTGGEGRGWKDILYPLSQGSGSLVTL